MIKNKSIDGIFDPKKEIRWKEEKIIITVSFFPLKDINALSDFDERIQAMLTGHPLSADGSETECTPHTPAWRHIESRYKVFRRAKKEEYPVIFKDISGYMRVFSPLGVYDLYFLFFIDYARRQKPELVYDVTRIYKKYCGDFHHHTVGFAEIINGLPVRDARLYKLHK